MFGFTPSDEQPCLARSTWTGGTVGAETDWANTGNWTSGEIPESDFDVVLNPGHTYYPDIDENNAACGNLILTEDASLGITTSGKLSVSKSMFIQSPLALLTFSNGTLELEYNLNLTNTNLTLTDFILTVNNNMNLYSGTTLI